MINAMKNPNHQLHQKPQEQTINTDIHPFLPQKRLFKAYDIRGEMRWFTDDFIWSLANAFARLYASCGDTVVIGFDVREHSEAIAKFLAFACHSKGLQVIWLGQVTMPILAFVANQYAGNGLMVTASHSEKQINGVKWLVNHESPSSDDILQLFEQLNEESELSADLLANIDNIIHQIHISTTHFADYQSAIHQGIDNIYQNIYADFDKTIDKTVDKNFDKKVDNFSQKSAQNQPLAIEKIVIDCMNGATARFAKDLFSSFGLDCVMLNDTPDPNFPKGNPDPCEGGRLHELCQSILLHQADMGLAFDGDGDRLMVADHTGTPLSPDNLLYLLAGIAIDEYPKQDKPVAEVIFDVKCSHHLPVLIEQRGAVPVMEKTGSSLMRKSLQNKSRFSIFAGELSGHFLFNDGYFVLHDDAMYAGIRLINWLNFQQDSLKTIINNLPKSVSTPDMYIPIDSSESGQLLIERLLKLTKKPFWAIKKRFWIKNVQTIDGLRLDFGYGFGILRKSNTGNFLTVRFSANTLEDLQKVQNVFVDLCHFIDENPNKPIAKIVANIQPI